MVRSLAARLTWSTAYYFSRCLQVTVLDFTLPSLVMEDFVLTTVLESSSSELAVRRSACIAER